MIWGMELRVDLAQEELSSAAVAAGLVMWAAIVVTTPVTSEVGGTGATLSPSIHLEGI